MKKISFFLLVWVISSTGWAADQKVNFIYDGDTIRVGTTHVRLIGVNTPERAWKEKGHTQQCYAKEAQRFLEQELWGKKVRLHSDRLSQKIDKYGRKLSYVYLGKKLINLELVRLGYGVAYTRFPFSKKKEFVAAQEEAKKNKVGLWKVCRGD